MRKVFALFIVVLAATAAQAQVSLCPIFSNNMVLQQNSEHAPIWGTSRAGKVVKITTSWDNQTYVAKADANGKWRTSMTTPAAGGPYTITISDGSKKKTILDNVMIGEVWLCSGQSNMEMPVEGWGRVKDYLAEERDADNYPDIRMLIVDHVTSPVPQEEVSVAGDAWQVCNSTTVKDFSATAYFFGRELYQHFNVPIGLIDTSWGGTIIEAWMSREAFEGIADQEHNLKAIEDLPASPQEREELFKEQYEQWLDEAETVIATHDADSRRCTLPTYDASAWSDYPMPTLASIEGTINTVWWVRTIVDIPQAWEGKELILNLGKIDDNDVTYFNGTPVGNTVGCVYTRSYTVPAELVTAGKAVIAIRVHDTGGSSGTECEEKDFNITLAGTDEVLPLAGNWKFKTAVNTSLLPPMPPNTSNDPNVHTFLYNAMIHPFVPFAIKGAIWYQGEANVYQAYQYRDLMPMMIHDWRTKWGYDFPFLMVQLANFMQRVDHPQESAWAELREAQYKTRCTLDKVGMATIIDIGEADDIHPKNKQEVGRRLALAARHIAYEEDIAYEGPLYSGYKIKGDKIRLRFTRSTQTGLTAADGGALRGFEVAGPDHVWHAADAIVKGETVIVSAPDVPFPLAVRYAWADNPDCNLTNSTGLPASPFRTDEWEGVSFGCKR